MVWGDCPEQAVQKQEEEVSELKTMVAVWRVGVEATADAVSWGQRSPNLFFLSISFEKLYIFSILFTLYYCISAPLCCFQCCKLL